MNPQLKRRCLTILAGLLILSGAGIYFFNVSAQTEKIEAPGQNLVNGRLAYTRQVTAMFQERFVETSDADGANRVTFPTQSMSNFATEPTWSPDGTKVAFILGIGTTDVWVGSPTGTGLINLTNTGSSIEERNPSWSASGKIAYERRITQTGTPQIWTMNADGGGQAQFTAITQPSPTHPAWSPDGSKLAFVSGGEIWVINANGTNEVRITTNSTADTDPSWSPDGSKLVFARGTIGLATINANGTGETPLTSANDTQPAWSPDGTKIAFKGSGGVWAMDSNGANSVRILSNSTDPFPAANITYENPAWQPVAQAPNTHTISGRVVYEGRGLAGVTMNLTGTTKQATTTDTAGNYSFSGLTAGGNYSISPSRVRHYFTPANRSIANISADQSGVNFDVLGVCVSGRCVRNGRKIAFSRDGEVYTVLDDGTGLTNITNNPAGDAGSDWSPDGVKILFSSNRDGNYEIYRMNFEGDPNPTRLTNNPASDSSPRYSPDGSSIVFISNRDGNSQVYKMNSDGSNQVRVTNNPGSDQSASFSPDGQKIIFFRQPGGGAPWSVLTINADGTNEQPIIGPATFLTSPSYSPDGKKIILVFGADITQQTIYTANADGTNLMQAGFGRSQPAYSPDGSKVVHHCCFSPGGPSPDGLFVTALPAVTLNRLTTSNVDFSPDWQPLAAPRPALFDFDGDGRSDQAIFRPSTNDWWILSSINSAQLAFNWGTATDVLAPADYDGDLKTDIAVWRPSTGNFHILNSFNFTVRVENFGLAGDIPTGGDFDGDGKAEVAVYRPGSGGGQSTFYYRASMGNPSGNISVVNWGIAGDKPVVGDYDNDARADTAIYRPSNGTWYINQSSNGQLYAVNFGLADDKTVQADYDGDGKTDIAVYRNGIWYLLRSALGFGAFQFGLAGDSPAPADYDGDGKADAAIFRNGVWWMLKSQTGSAEAVQFGLASDTPVLSAYVR